MAARATTLAIVPKSPAPKPKPKVGLRAWMERVLVECDRAAAGFEADPVHDLRVAIRRCRSLADGLIALDSDPAWKEMKKAGRKLFRALGELRDMQVLEGWIEKLARDEQDKNDPVVVKLLDHIRSREADCKQLAWRDLDQFDRKHWRQWSRTLPRRASRVRPGSVVYLHLALEKWTTAYDLHKRAIRTRSQVALHELRIGIKRFRYTVENFLPEQHAKWGSDLKELQDLLGEVHDLDVLWSTVLATQAFPDLESRRHWHEKITHERNRRVERYREMMLGKQSLWRAWRAQLPQGPQLRAAALSRLRTWASFLDPDFAHSQRVSHLALHLYEGLVRAGVVSHAPGLVAHAAGTVSHRAAGGTSSASDAREILQAAAFMHDVGKAKGHDNHHKKSYRMIRKLARPLGWTPRELELAALVARYHRGALPRPRSKAMQFLELPDRHLALQLSGILRLANALDLRNGAPPKLTVELHDRVIRIQAAGYSPLDRQAENIAAARHLLETVLRLPVIVKPLSPSHPRPRATSHR
ncbi:MAG TPA: CHAD domain-containing protein [Terriglobales bacterium]|nr:CHAD domain-containing protein [Terriglobales bacterium]